MSTGSTYTVTIKIVQGGTPYDDGKGSQGNSVAGHIWYTLGHL